MSDLVPLGSQENQRLEFKSSRALKHLFSVGREVVAMLNAKGGELWIGLGEEDGRAVRAEPIENPERELGRLRDYFSDAIEPSPLPGEIKTEVVPVEQGGYVLRVQIHLSRGSRGPYALREGTARHFLRRIEDRVRPMSREDIFSGEPKKSENHDLLRAKKKILHARNRRRKKKLLWLRIQPVGDLRIELHEVDRRYFTDPLATGNRATGWNFADPYRETKRETKCKPNAIRHGQEDDLCVRVFTDGAIEFSTPISSLYWKSAVGSKGGDEKQIWPYCLLEFPISVFRLASTIYREHGQNNVKVVLGDLALFGLRGWTLRPHSPRSIGYAHVKVEPFGDDDLVFPEPLSFGRDEIVQKPDQCGFRLVKQVYEAFGYAESDIPQEFDREREKLLIPVT